MRFTWQKKDRNHKGFHETVARKPILDKHLGISGFGLSSVTAFD